MQPFFNSFLPHPNQHNPNASAPPLQQQNFPHNNPQGMGMMNPLMQIPFSNPNFSQLIPQPSNGFMNAQNNCFNVPPQAGQFNMGPQLGVPNLSNNPLLAQLCSLLQGGNQMNPQLLHNLCNSMNMPQQMNQNMALPNMQQQFSVQDFSKMPPPQIPNHSQGVSNYFGNNLPFNPANSGGFGPNQQNFVQPMGNVKASNPSHPAGLHQNQNLQSAGFSGPQGQSVNNAHNNISSSNGHSLHHNKFSNPRGSKWGSQKAQFHGADNGKRDRFFKENKGKGHWNQRPGKPNQFDSSNTAKEKKRSLAFLYTEKEILQWREERRKNYPSKTNIEKKLKRKPADGNVDEEARLRSQQLKEILEKQAQLGVEVAEIPSHYFSDEKLAHGREENNMGLNKRNRFQNKHNARNSFENQHNKRGKYGRKDKFDKKQRFGNKDSSKVSSSRARTPTLLQKLLSADMKRDKYSLLQVFRFMVMNSFFGDCHEEPLKFPCVVVKEGSGESEVLEEKSLLVKEDIPDGSSKGKSKASDDNIGVDEDGDGDDDECENDFDAADETVDKGIGHDAQAELGDNKESVNGVTQNQDEEGEIID